MQPSASFADCLIISSSDGLTFCLPYFVTLPNTNCLSVWLSIHLSPLSDPHPSICLIWSLSLSLSVRNERNLQQKQQLAGGLMSHDILHTTHPTFSLLLCVRRSTIRFAFTDTHLIYTEQCVVITCTMTTTDASIHHSEVAG